MGLGAHQGYVNMPRWNDRNMISLCAKALEAEIETGYVQKLIRIHSLGPDETASGIETWPWPLKIYTLGRFELVKEGEPVRFPGKVQQKPLALLKAMIAFGGSAVPEEQITDLLWPDADGDLAHQSFEMTVHRLRRLIGNGNVIQLQGRLLTLDFSQCWVDLHALEDLLRKASTAWKATNGSPGEVAAAVQLSEKVIGSYSGHFLPGDSAQSWVLSTRERLQSKLLRVLSRLGTHREQSGQWESAAELYQKGLEVDVLVEEFYQHLMVCHQQLGRRSEAIAVYNRCRSLLTSKLGIVPSLQTEYLYQSLKTSH
jgi:DNA-binding SARP family transcriptional activator